MLNHRRKFKRMDASYGFEPDWGMVLCLRLACIFARPRRDSMPGTLQLSVTGNRKFCLRIDRTWLKENSLVNDDLKIEARHWKRLDYKLKLKPSKAVKTD